MEFRKFLKNKASLLSSRTNIRTYEHRLANRISTTILNLIKKTIKVYKDGMGKYIFYSTSTSFIYFELRYHPYKNSKYQFVLEEEIEKTNNVWFFESSIMNPNTGEIVCNGIYPFLRQVYILILKFLEKNPTCMEYV